MKISTTWRNDNPNTIWNALARKLGRDPTNAEATEKVRQIFQEVTIDLAGAGKLPHQRKRSAA